MTVRNTILCLTIVFISNTCWAQNIFIPSPDGYVEKEFPIEDITIPKVTEYLGYDASQFHSYLNIEKLGGEITVVVFRVFTDSIICVMTNDDVSDLSEMEVKSYIENYSFNEAYDALYIQSKLDKAIENKAYTVDFIRDIFNRCNIDRNGSFIAYKIGYELFFKNGILSKYKPSDGPKDWATTLKDRDYPEEYVAAAKKYWGDNYEMIVKEVHTQFLAQFDYLKTPEDDYMDLHITDEGTINFKMLLVTHYGEEITLDEFKTINHGRYELISEYNDKEGNKMTKYKVDQTIHKFDENGNHISSYTVN